MACGDRGCGNVGLQLATTLDAGDLPVVFDVLRAIPDVPDLPHRGEVWHGDVVDRRPVVR